MAPRLQLLARGRADAHHTLIFLQGPLKKSFLREFFCLIRNSLLASRALPFLLAASAAHAQAFLPEAASPLPDAPLPVSPVLRAALPAKDPAFALPRGWRPHPAASRSNAPGKVGYYLCSTVSLRVPLEAFAVAGVPALTAPPHLPQAPSSDDPVLAQLYQHAIDAYGDQIDVWRRVSETELRTRGYRLGVGLSMAETRQLFSNLVLPLTLRQEARYIPAPVHSDFSERLGHALASVVVTHNDAGDAVPNYSKLGGTVAAAFVAKSVYARTFHAPALDSTHFAARYIAYSLAGDAATNTVHELTRAAPRASRTLASMSCTAARARKATTRCPSAASLFTGCARPTPRATSLSPCCWRAAR